MKTKRDREIMNEGTAARFTYRLTLLASVSAMFVSHADARAEQSVSEAVPSEAEVVSQQDSAAGAPAVDDEIVVTAMRRSQQISDVGLTITAATSEQLAQAGVTSVEQLASVVPGFSSGTTYGGFPIFSLRGVNFNSAQFSASPAVSVYLDEAPLPYSAMTAGAIMDLSQVEVVKGPQGTLFGQNTTGGSINIIPASPTDDPTGGFRVEANHFGEVSGEGFVSGPLGPTLKARLAVSTTQFGTWQRGYYLTPDFEWGDQNRTYGRLTFQWEPSSRVRVQLIAAGGYDKSEPQLSQLNATIPQNPSLVLPALLSYPLPNDNRDVENDNAHRLDNHNYQFALKSVFDINDQISLTSITNYVDFRFYNFRDIDHTALAIENTAFLGDGDSLSQEIRLNGGLASGKVSYVLGGNYQTDEILDAEPMGEFIAYSAFPGGVGLDTFFTAKNRAWGIFGNVDFDVDDRLTVSGGLRYAEARQAIEGCVTGNAVGTLILGGIFANQLRQSVGLPPTDAYVTGGCLTMDDTGSAPTFLPAFIDLEQNEDSLSWRLGINYDVSDDLLLYGYASRGYKAGLFPVQVAILASQMVPATQEKLTAYETGLKWNPGREISINAAFFYYDYKDKQFYTYRPSPVGPSSTVVNIPSSRAYGVDFDVSLQPTDRLTLRTAWTYLNSRIGDFQSFNVQLQPVDFTGSPFNLAPEWSGTFDAEYEISLDDGLDGYLGGSGRYNSTTYSDLGEAANTRIPSYTVIDVRAGVRSENGWELGVFTRNILDEYYWTNVVPGADATGRFAGRPRTFSVFFKQDFR